MDGWMNGWTRERSTVTKITRKLIIFFFCCYNFLWDFTCIASVCVYVCLRLKVFVNRFYFCLFFFRLSTLDFRCCFSFVVVAIRSILLEIDGKYQNFQKNTRILKINQQRILKYFFFGFVYSLFLFNHETRKNRRTFDFTFEPKRNVNNFFFICF